MTREQKQFVWSLYDKHLEQGGESRDYLPYTDEFDRMQDAYNSRFNLLVGKHEFWRNVINTLRTDRPSD